MTLKSFIAGEIDSDRLDYTIRDGHACGTEIGRFDLDRIISNAILSSSVAKEGDFKLVFYERALSGIEQFFTQRYEGYKYLIYHRAAVRSESCLRVLIAYLFFVAYQFPNSEVALLMRHFGYINLDETKDPREVSELLPTDEHNLVRLDDANLRTLLFEMYWKSQENESDSTPLKIKDSHVENIVLALLKIVLFRSKDHVINPLKEEGLHSRALRLHEAGEINDRHKTEELFSAYSEPQFRKELSDDLARKVFSRTQGHVIAVTASMTPKVYSFEGDTDHQIYVLDQQQHVIPLHEKSIMLQNMAKRKEQDQNFNVYFVGHDVRANDDLKAKVSRAFDEFLIGLWKKDSFRQ